MEPYFPKYLGLFESEEDDDEEIKQFVEASKSDETKRKMSSWVNMLQNFATASDLGDPIKMCKQELNKLLCLFIIQMKKSDGSEYETSSMYSAVSLLGRYVREIGKGDIDKDSEYLGLRDVKKAKLKVLKSAGKGNRPNQALPISQEEEDALYAAGQFGLSSPEALQRTLWWHMTVLFGHRGRDESRQLKWGDVQLKTDSSGTEYLEFNERLTKTRDGASTSGSRAFSPKAFENKENKDRCPVAAYKLFAARRPEAMMKPDSPFFLTINHRWSPDSATEKQWYANMQMGKNLLSSMLKTACERAGIQGKRTNHSARKSCVKRALDAGCPREYVAQLTGHKSVSSLENYAVADINVQRALSTSIMTGASFTDTAGNKRLGSAATSTQVAAKATVVFNITNCQNVSISNN